MDDSPDDYRVDLEVFNGPLDLLLHLIKREELNIYDIPISRILKQFLERLAHMQKLDIDGIGDFLVMASTLMVIKSRLLLPQAPADDEEQPPDPRTDLVRQLLEYRRFKELGSLLRERLERYERTFPRGVAEVREREAASAQEPDLGRMLEDIGSFDLFQAFSKVLSEIRVSAEREIVYDETPLEVHIDRLETLLAQSVTVPFSRLFAERRDRAYVIGVFLAALELIRQGRALVTQLESFGEIVLCRRPLLPALPPDSYIEPAAPRA